MGIGTALSQEALAQSTSQIKSWLSANPNASDAEMRKVMDENGIFPWQVAAATGIDAAEADRRYNAAQPSASTQPPSSTPSAAVSSTPPVAANLDANYWTQIYKTSGGPSVQSADPSGAYGAGFESSGSASQGAASSQPTVSSQSPISSGGLINSVTSNPSYQSTRPNVFSPAKPSAPSLVSVNESRTSLPQMNANAVSAISGLPINQSRFANAGQPSGMLYQANPNYLSDIDLQKTLTPQDYISRFGVKA